MDAAHLTPLMSHCFPQMEFDSLCKMRVTIHAKQEPLISWLRAIRDSMRGRPCPSLLHRRNWKGPPKHGPAQRCPHRHSFS